MLTRIKIPLSALLVVGFASATLASGTPENKLGDRYPFLEQAVQQPAGASAYAAARNSQKGFTAAEKALFDRAKGNW